MKKKETIESRFLNPLTDFGFHRLFGTESSKKFLISFLNEIIREDNLITDIQYLPPAQRGFTEKERKAVFDIFCTNEKGEYFIVEMQRARQKFFRDRSLFYASLPILKQAPQGIWNFQLKAVYLVAVMDFVIFNEFEEDKDHVVEFVKLIRERTKSYFSKKINLVFIELPKFKKEEEELKSYFDLWLYSLKNMDQIEEFPKFVYGNIFEELFQAAEINKLTQKEMKEYKKSVLEYRDVRDSLEFAREEASREGHEQGFKEGREEGYGVGHEEGFGVGHKIGHKVGHRVGQEEGHKVGQVEGRKVGHKEGHKKGREEGHKEGHKKGREDEKASIIQKCFQRNMPIEDIVFITGFSKDQIALYATKQKN
jgi:predicted transposase/invertase (TIGR01784 family)